MSVLTEQEKRLLQIEMEKAIDRGAIEDWIAVNCCDGEYRSGTDDRLTFTVDELIELCHELYEYMAG